MPGEAETGSSSMESVMADPVNIEVARALQQEASHGQVELRANGAYTKSLKV
jgi:hypothetical protein